jgi:phage I-like protein
MGDTKMKRVALLLAPLLLGTSAVFAASADTCLNCHEPDEIKGKSAEEVVAALSDAANKNHRRVKDLTAEEVEAILAELQGG